MKIRVKNQLIVYDPIPAVRAYCEKNLIIDNPDYYKLEKMGKWTGSTPKKLYLYESIAHDIKMPFGCLNDLWKIHPVKDDYIFDISPVRETEYQSNINLYPYQENAVTAAIKGKNGILVMPCGSGKTQCGLEIISRIGGRALWLTHTQDLLNQSKQRAEKVLGHGGYGTITAGKVNIGSTITFATVQTMAKIDLSSVKDAFDVIIVDECMPGETLIDTPAGKKELKNLCIDDIITSYNRNERKIENKRITHIFKSKAHDIVKVKLSNGEEIICTKNHPIYTRSGQWIEAERLVRDDYVLRLVWEGSRNRYDAENIKAQSIKERLLLLLKRMFRKGRSQKGCVDRRAQESCIRNNEKNKQSVSRSVCGKNENTQSDERCKCTESCFRQVEKNRTSSKNQMRQRSGINCSSTNADACTCGENGSVCRVSYTNKNGKRFQLSDLLQGGHSNPRKNDCNRGGRRFSYGNQAQKTGSKERAVFEWVRVESIEVQEQTSDGTFGGLCADGYVYNIEVEDNNNYFANGILVHNCQHCAGTPTRVTQFYKVISNLSARYKIGLTATPKRADGLQCAMFALLGQKLHEVSREEVAHTTCPVQVIKIDTEWMPDYECILMGDGTIDYSKVIDNMIHDDKRFFKVMDVINEIPDAAPTLVLANRVEYLQDMLTNYEKTGVCISGAGQSKKAKAERKAALEKLDNCEIDCIFATYQLAKEGLDVPNLRYVVFATPEQDSTTVIQSVGRVGRKADGKDCGTVIDFVDLFGLYQGYWKKRKGYYKKIGAEVFE